MKKLLLIMFIMFLISACGEKPSTATSIPTSTEAPIASPTVALQIEPKVTPVCISPDPTQVDIDRALAYPGDLFDAPDWERSYTVSDGRVSVAWLNSPLSAVAVVEALVFPCSYEEPDLNYFFSAENWEVVFSNYDSFESTAACKTDVGIRLYQFIATTEGIEYDIKYWAENDTDTRVMGAMLVFPSASPALMDEYSSYLFPTFTSCS